jgi:alkylation response protein AidB-like acyl-CoA dehydrogenase
MEPTMATGTEAAADIELRIAAIAAEWRGQRSERQRRRELDPADFARLAAAGFLLTGVPVADGGIVASPATSVRLVAGLLRALARADASVALVAAMHPAVMYTLGWLPFAEAPPPYTADWAAQRHWAFATARDGAWWGTITSEPGSGGDIQRTRATARPDVDGSYRLSGQKHFGSGSGVTSFMMTTAVAEGEEGPSLFFIDVRGVPWDGSAGVTLTAPWDGAGMAATQSHAMRFDGVPARRTAWPDVLRHVLGRPGGFVPCLFAAVVVGVVEEALETARQQLEPRHASLRPYEQVEWTRARIEGWLIEQAFEGMLRSTEADGADAALGKAAIAELAESVLSRLSRVLGGGAYSRSSPFAFWYEDVRALGFLRPPWGLAYDQIFAAAAPQPAS